jgi:flagellar hook-associated protein 1
LQVIGNNIANANTQGYSRQSVELATAQPQYSGSGYFGKGVDVRSVGRAHNDFLTREVALSRSQASADATRSTQLQELEKVFPLGETGIAHAANEFLNAFVDVASQPQDTAARQVALSRAEEVAARFRTAGAQIDGLQNGVTHDLQAAVSKVNALASRFADLNAQIAGSQGSGHVPNDLMDQRDQLLRDLNEQLQVSSVAADDGSLSLFIGGGQALVLGASANALATTPDEYDPRALQIGLRDGGAIRRLPDALLVGGTISGLLHFQHEDLATARNLLGQLAAAVSGAVNTQQALGLDQKQPAAAGGPVFAAGLPQVLGSVANAKDSIGNPLASYVNAQGVRVPSVGLTVTDASQLEASDYELRQDPAGGAGLYQLTRLSDGVVRSVASGDQVDGFRLDVSAPLPAAADRFLLRPVAGAATDIRRVLDDPRGIAAAASFTASPGVNNLGTASVASVQAVSAAADRTLSASLSFTSGSGDYDWELRNASNVVVFSGSSTWQAGQPIVLNGWELQINGVPQSGDTLSVLPTAFAAGNNGNAKALVALRDLDIVGRRAGAGGMQAGNTLTDAYANTLTEVGVRVQSQRTAERISTSVATDAELSRSSQAGVNLDEEAARLIQFQQAYQASAKILQVAQSTFDTLLQIGR